MKRLLPAALIMLLACAGLGGQALEVMESTGFVEVNLPTTGWRQAVVGRQIPAGSTLTSWLSAGARMEYKGSVVKIGSGTYARITAVETDAVRISLVSGSLSIDAPGPVAYEVEIRGMTIRIEAGSADVGADTISARGGKVTLSGRGDDTILLPEGGSVSLTEELRGPVFARE
jgi:hypothetical protein